MTKDWREVAARRIHLLFDLKNHAPQDTSIPALVEIIEENCPFKTECRHPAHYYPRTSIYEGDPCFCGTAHIPVGEGLKRSEPPLLQCIDCKNTESPAGAMARYFNHGRCLHCGGYFKVVRA